MTLARESAHRFGTKAPLAVQQCCRFLHSAHTGEQGRLERIQPGHDRVCPHARMSRQLVSNRTTIQQDALHGLGPELTRAECVQAT